MTFNDNKINLPRIITIKLRDKIKTRCLMKREPLLFHIMLKQGIIWFMFSFSTQETVQNNTSKIVYDNIGNFLDGLYSYARMQLLVCVLHKLLPIETMHVEVKVKTVRGIHTFRRDHTTQVISCKPWSPRLYPYSSILRKMLTYLELEGKSGTQLHTSTN